MRRASAFALSGLAIGALTLSGCGADPSAGGDDAVVVTTTTMLGSVVDDIVACNDATAVTVMGPGDDPHTFSPSSKQITQMAKAKLVVVNGLGLESNLDKAIDSARTEGATVLEVAPNVHPIPFGEAGEHAEDEHGTEEHADEHPDDDHEHDTHDGHDHGSEDPHFWLDAHRMADAAELIGAKLTEVTGDTKFTDCGEQVGAELTKVDEQVRATLAVIPADKRVIISDHDAFGYFAEAYDFEVAGVVVPGGSTDAGASSEHLAELVKVIRDRNVSTIFSNTAVNPKLVESLAAETGRDVKVVALHVGSVGPEGSGADTYAGMMTTNAQTIADALK